MGMYAQQQQAQVNLVLLLPWYGICSSNNRLHCMATGKLNQFLPDEYGSEADYMGVRQTVWECVPANNKLR